jgi:hypothetical protein
LSLFFFLGEFDDKTSFSFPLLTILWHAFAYLSFLFFSEWESLDDII